MTKKYTEEEMQGNELKRIENEENRIENEENRIENEAERVANEIERVANEKNRIENEAERVANEIVRNEFYEGFNDRLDTVNSQLEDNAKHIDNSTYNVKEFGAKGDGISDDWEAINNVLNLVKESGGVIFFPTGVYAISKPLIIGDNINTLHNIVFKGVPSNVPYYNSYAENPKKLAMNSNIIPTDNFSGEALIIFNKVANTLITDLALIGSDNRDFKGILYNYKKLISNHSVRNCAIFKFSIGIDGYYAPILKIEFTNVQYCSDTGVVIRGDSRVVECEISLCGVNLNGVANEMKSKTIFQPNGFYGGTGIRIIDNAGNVNIIGGLIDWNCKGIVADGASGLIINGTRFHHNAEQHIWIRSKSNTLGSCGFNINGCRFLGGGCLVGTLDGKSAITITNEPSFTNPIYGNITGNVFRFGDWDATEDSDNKISNPTETSGPLNSSIVIKTNCDTNITITGNDMINCASNGVLGATQTDTSKLTKVNMFGNNINKLGWRSGKVNYYFEQDVLYYNGIPTHVGVDGERTKNSTINVYDFDGFIYSTNENMWKGINQRSIKSGLTSERPSIKQYGYSYKGYMYMDTSLNKTILWDGSLWRDFNGDAV